MERTRRRSLSGLEIPKAGIRHCGKASGRPGCRSTETAEPGASYTGLRNCEKALGGLGAGRLETPGPDASYTGVCHSGKVLRRPRTWSK